MTGFLYDLLYSLPMVFFTGTFVNKYILGEELKPAVYLLMAVGCIFALMYRHFSMQLRIIVSGVCIFVLLGVYFALKSLKPEFFGEYGLFVLWEFLTGMAVSIVTVFLQSFITGKITCVFLLAASLLISLFTEIELSAFCVSMALLGVVLFLSELLQGGRSKGIKKYMVYLFPVFLAFSILLSISKAPADPYDWHHFIRAWENIKEKSFEIKQKLFHNNDEDYEAVMIGFSEDGRINGNLEDGEGHEIMKVVSSRQPGDNIYLVGTVFDTFEDTEWKNSGSENKNTCYFDCIEGFAAAYSLDSTHVTDYVRTEKMDVSFLSFSTKHAFAPSKTIEINLGGNTAETEYNTGSLLFDDTKGYKTVYRVLSSRLNRNEYAINELVSKNISVDEESYKRYLAQFGFNKREELSYEHFLEYKENIYKEYLPYTEVSEEMRKQLEYIMSLSDNPYERLCILEAELKNLVYTRTPGKLPENVKTPADFLDYFCFETGEGYCSHFATAFALMSRAMGIPSRFVQGYCVPVIQGEECMVTSNMAHAWVECYLPGAGWVPFDPSAGYAVGNYWQTSSEKSRLYGMAEYPSNIFAKEEESVPDQEEAGEPEDEEKERIHVKWYVVVLPLVGIILFVSGFFVLELNIFERRIGKAGLSKKAALLCKANMNMLSYCGYKVKAGETLEEFSERIGKEVSKTAVMFLPFYEKMLYSEEETGAKELSFIKESFDRIKLILREEKKILYYWYYLKGIRNT